MLERSVLVKDTLTPLAAILPKTAIVLMNPLFLFWRSSISLIFGLNGGSLKFMVELVLLIKIGLDGYS